MLCPALVGRDDELRRLVAVFDDLRGGGFRSSLVVGEVGIGKTALVDALLDRARSEQIVVRVARCWSHADTPPLWPWHQLLGDLTADLDAPSEASRAALAALRARPVGDADRARLLAGIGELVRAVSAGHPLVLVVDDLQWCDPLSIEGFVHLARVERTPGCLLVFTSRPVTSPSGPLSTIWHSAERLDLRPLSAPESERLVRVAHDAIAPGEAARIAERAQGNPFFLLELTRASEQGERGIPESVAAVLTRNLDRLDHRARTVVEASAIVGRPVGTDLVAALTGLDREVVATAVLDAAGIGILRVRGHRVELSHALAAEAVVSGIDATTQARMHAAVADHLAGHGADINQVAWHTRAGGPFVPVDLALPRLLAAGRHAAAAFAYEQAIDNFLAARHALVDWDVDTRKQVLLELGRVQALAADVDGAQRTLGELAGLARSTDDAPMLAEAALAYPPSLEGIESGPMTTSPDQLRLLEDALAAIGHQHPELRARLLGSLALGLYWAGDERSRASRFPATLERIDALTTEGLALATTSDDPEVLEACLQARLAALWGPDAVGERQERATAWLDVALRSGDLWHEFGARSWLVLDHFMFGRLSLVDEEIERAAGLSDRLHHPFPRWMVSRWRSLRSFIDGRIDDAEALAYEAYPHGEEAIGQPTAAAVLGATVGMYEMFRGRLHHYRASAEEAHETHPSVVGWSAALLGIYAEEGEIELVRGLYEELAVDGFAGVPRDIDWLTSIVWIADAATFLGDRRHGAALYDLARPFADLDAIGGGAYSTAGPMSRVLGQLAFLAGDEDRARAHLRHAASGPRRDPWRLLARRFLAAMDGDADALDRTGDRMRRLGMSVETLDRRLLRCLPSPTGARAASGGGAVRAEGTAARLARQGETWQLRFGGVTTSIRHSIGLEMLALLLERPGRELPVLDIRQAIDGASAVERGADPDLDHRAVREYRDRLAELTDDVEEAEANADLERATRARIEMEALVDELSRDQQRQNPTVERARVSVTRAIRRAIDAIDDHHPIAAGHLRLSVRTGSYCRYQPDPSHRVDWTVSR